MCITYFRPRGLWVGLACLHCSCIIISACACQDTLCYCLINLHGQKHSCVAEQKPSLLGVPLFMQRGKEKRGYRIMMEVKVVDCGEGPLVCLSINLKITPIFTGSSFLAAVHQAESCHSGLFVFLLWTFKTVFFFPPFIPNIIPWA